MVESCPDTICDTSRQRSAVPKSVYDDARAEAEKHKWLESEKNGCDLGHQAIEDWYQNFWGKYCRTRRLEHLTGVQHWVEFAADECGQMYELLISGNDLLHDLIHKFEQGWENLDFVRWMHDSQKSPEEIDHMIGLLKIINVNIARLEPRLHTCVG